MGELRKENETGKYALRVDGRSKGQGWEYWDRTLEGGALGEVESRP